MKNEQDKCPQCSAKSKRSGERCKNRAMTGKKVCRIHGGKAVPAPKGNKRALKTGENETILLETLDQDEAAYFHSIVPDPIAECEEKVKLLKVRELRIMRRIQSLRGKLALVDGQDAGMVVVGGAKSQVSSPAGKTTTVSATTRSPEALLSDTEEALTRVQNELGRWVDRLATYREKYGKNTDDDSVNIQVHVVDMR